MYTLDITMDITWNLIMEHLKDNLEERRKQREENGAPKAPPKKVDTSPPLQMPEWYMTPTPKAKETLKQNLKISREKLEEAKKH